MNAIESEGLCRQFAEKKALENLSLALPQGSVFGFLGPNGAGKTTTVKLFTGLLAPTRGSCAVMGLDPYTEAEKVHALCGVMTESARMYPQLGGLDNLLFFGELCGLARAQAKDRGEELLKKLDLMGAGKLPAGKYSTGMAQRLSLARALLGRPRVLFLDEPTSGLDPESAQAVNELIAEQAGQEGVTVFLCTHQLRYAQDLCDSYGILDHGVLLAEGSLSELAALAGRGSFAAFRLAPGETLAGYTLENGWHRRPLSSPEEMPGLLREAIAAGRSVYEARIETPTLEDVYFSFINREEGGSAPC